MPKVNGRESASKRLQSSDGQGFTAKLVWTPEEGVMVTPVMPRTPLDTRGMENLSRFLQYTVKDAVRRFDAEQQYAYINPLDFGLVPRSLNEVPGVQGYTHLFAAEGDIDFGSLILYWEMSTPSYSRPCGKWNVMLNGVTIQQGLIGMAEWNDRAGFAALAEKVKTDDGVAVIEMALTHESLVSKASQEWNRNKAASAYSATMPKNLHTPYTAVAKLLGEHGFHGGRYSRKTEVVPLELPSGKACAVLVKFPQGKSGSVESVLSARWQKVEGVVFPQEAVSEKAQVWATDARVFADPENQDLLNWISWKATAANNAYHPTKCARA